VAGILANSGTPFAALKQRGNGDRGFALSEPRERAVPRRCPRPMLGERSHHRPRPRL